MKKIWKYLNTSIVDLPPQVAYVFGLITIPIGMSAVYITGRVIGVW